MTYQKAISYLQSFVDYEKLTNYSYKTSFELERIKSFLESIGNPQKYLKVIHVAGSKGKGSVCAFISYILRQVGFKVGLYTSPHLHDFRERIRILDKIYNPKSTIQKSEFEGMISRNDISKLVSRLKPAIDNFNHNSKRGCLTFFEVYTAIAYQYFKAKKVDFVVLETGLGGRLDATNVCSSLLSVITPISLEHTIRLGRSLEKISIEKASIIKKENKKIYYGKNLALTSKQDRRVIDVIDRMAKKNNASLLKEGRDFKFYIKRNSSFDYKGLDSKIKNLRINILGSHQIANASLAIASVEAMRYHNIVVDKKAIRDGLKLCLWPARFEIISKKPLIVIDGAQNSASVVALRKTLGQNFPNKRTWVIFGIFKDKEVEGTCREIAKISKRIILTKLDNPRASRPSDLLRFFSHNSLLLTTSIKEAVDLAKTKMKKNDLILVTGSLYLCGQTRSMR